MDADTTGGQRTDDAEPHAHEGDAPPGPTRGEGASEDGGAGTGREEGFDLKGIVRQLTAPMIESLDSRLRDQIEAHVDELLTARIEAAVADRLSTVDRAIADLSRSIADLERRLRADERAEGHEPLG